MNCFNFFKRGGKKIEPKPSNSTVRTRSGSNSNSLNVSTLTEQVRRGILECNSQDISDVSTESLVKNSYPSMSTDNNLRVFLLSELRMATKNFHRLAKIGEGGFGCVFKGVIDCLEDPEKKIDVAVKQLGIRGLQGHKEWVTEVNVLGVVDHPNLVKLVGYCADDDERGIQRLLVYEYMPNRSVEDHLSSRFSTPLPWSMRLKIARDSARGLAYLHEGMDFQIIFRDFKSSNILLDQEWNAKLSDFGLARLGPEEGMTHISTVEAATGVTYGNYGTSTVMIGTMGITGYCSNSPHSAVGTLGYAAPEYIQTGHLTYKSDVYGYGVFLYELITGRPPIDRHRPNHEQKLIEWIKPHLVDLKSFRQILDPRLEWNNGLVKSAQKLAVIANRCLVRVAKTRPKMSEVLEMVNQLVEASQESEKEGKSEEEMKKGVKRGEVDKVVVEENCMPRLWMPKLVNLF